MLGFDITATVARANGSTLETRVAAQRRAVIADIEASYRARGYEVAPLAVSENFALSAILRLTAQLGPLTQDLQTETERCQKRYGQNWQQSCTIAQNLERRVAAVNATIDAHRELVERFRTIARASSLISSRPSPSATAAAAEAKDRATVTNYAVPGGTRVTNTATVTTGTTLGPNAARDTALATAAFGQASAAVEGGIAAMLDLSKTMAGNVAVVSADYERKYADTTLTAADWAQQVAYMAGQVRVADEQRARAASLLKEVEFYGGKHAALATRVAQAKQLFGLIEAYVNKLSELERFSVDALTAHGGTTADVAAATANVRTFPVWGYLVGGAVIIGGALFLSRK